MTERRTWATKRSERLSILLARYKVNQGECPLCHRPFYPVRVQQVYCMCSPIKVRDTLSNILGKLCSGLDTESDVA